MANNDFEAGLRGETVGHDVFSYSYQLGAQQRERNLKGGGTPGVEGMVAGASGGILFIAFAVILAFCAFVLSFCSYPIAGIATLIGFGIGSALFNGGGAQMNFMGLMIALMVPCYIVYHLCWPLEQRMGKNPTYQMIRQYWRMVVGAFAVHTLGTAFHMKSQYPDGAPLSGYLIDYAMTAASVFLFYLNSLRLDAKYGLEPREFPRVEKILAPVLRFIVPDAPRDITETGVIAAKTLAGEKINIGISAANGNIMMLGEERIPAAGIQDIGSLRERRGWLIFGGVVIFFFSPALVGGIFGDDFEGFFSQLFGLAGLIAGAAITMFGAIENTPPGLLGGPFRTTAIAYENAEKRVQFLQIRFASPMDERRFRLAATNIRGRAWASAPAANAAAKAA